MANIENIILIDFKDSFTFNIATLVYTTTGKSLSIVPFEQFNCLWEKIQKRHNLLILGPGPGHPDEYLGFTERFHKVMQDPKQFIWGICLGHQILLKLLGGNVVLSKVPRHGQSQIFEVPAWSDIFDKDDQGKKTLVQRYNSLGVKISTKLKVQNLRLSVSDQEILAFAGKNLWGVQFHPESIGTQDSKVFFKFIRNLVLRN